MWASNFFIRSCCPRGLHTFDADTTPRFTSLFGLLANFFQRHWPIDASDDIVLQILRRFSVELVVPGPHSSFRMARELIDFCYRPPSTEVPTVVPLRLRP